MVCVEGGLCIGSIGNGLEGVIEGGR